MNKSIERLTLLSFFSLQSSGFAQTISVPEGARPPTKWAEMMGVWLEIKTEENEYSNSTLKRTLAIKDYGATCSAVESRYVSIDEGKYGDIDIDKRDPICSPAMPDFYTFSDKHWRSLSWVKEDLSEMDSLLYKATFQEFWERVNWLEYISLNLQCPGTSTSEAAKNRLRTSEYANLYKMNPQLFKWSGMAAFASDTVGLGIRLSNFFAEKPLLKGVATEMLNFLSEGNRAVYNDIYWQHEAYRIGGIEEIRRNVEIGNISERQATAWERIETGKKQNDQELIWEGNQMLLRYEQELTLQPIYEKYSDVASMMSPFMYSPIPNNPTDFFQRTVPFGNIGSFDDRWSWIDKSMLPSWKDLSDGQSQEAVAEMESLLESNKGACKDDK